MTTIKFQNTSDHTQSSAYQPIGAVVDISFFSPSYDLKGVYTDLFGQIYIWIPNQN